MAIADGMALNLEDDAQGRLAKDRGQEQLKLWEDNYRKDYTDMVNKIHSALWSSLRAMMLVLALALVIAASLEKVSFSLPFDLITFLTCLGSSLVGWATLMELGGNIPVFDGDTFPQLVHAIIFKSIFLLGVFLVIMGILLL